MPALIKTLAIILKKKQILGKDVVVTLLSLQNGKLSVIAKGLKNLTSRRSPHIQTGNLVEIVVARGNSGSYLQQSNLISGFADLKSSPEKLEYLYTFFFIVDRIIPEEQIEPQIFEISKSFLVKLSKQENYPALLEQHLFRLLAQLGYLHEPRSLDQLINLTEEIINEKVPRDVII